MHYRANARERSVIQQYALDGYECLTKGYPDMCFFNENEVVFVEVKRKQKRPSTKMGLSPHQRKMHEIFARLGFTIKVVYV